MTWPAVTGPGRWRWPRLACGRSRGSSSPRGLRDRAIILCVARLGMRASEIVRLRLEDLDWCNATVRVRARKTGHGALLPLTAEVGTALAVYLRDGRPGTPSRQVFVLHWLREGAPVSASIVNRAVDNAHLAATPPAPRGPPSAMPAMQAGWAAVALPCPRAASSAASVASSPDPAMSTDWLPAGPQPCGMAATDLRLRS